MPWKFSRHSRGSSRSFERATQDYTPEEADGAPFDYIPPEATEMNARAPRLQIAPLPESCLNAMDDETDSDSDTETEFSSPSSDEPPVSSRALEQRFNEICSFSDKKRSGLPVPFVELLARLDNELPTDIVPLPPELPPCALMDNTIADTHVTGHYIVESTDGELQPLRIDPNTIPLQCPQSTPELTADALAMRGASRAARAACWQQCMEELPDIRRHMTPCAPTSHLSPLAQNYSALRAQWVYMTPLQVEEAAWRGMNRTIVSDVLRTDMASSYIQASQLYDELSFISPQCARICVRCAASALPGVRSPAFRPFHHACDSQSRPVPLNCYRVHSLLLTLARLRGGYQQGMSDIAVLALSVASNSAAHDGVEATTRIELRRQLRDIESRISDGHRRPRPLHLTQALLDRLTELDATAFGILAGLTALHPISFGSVNPIPLFARTAAVHRTFDPVVRVLLDTYCHSVPKDGDALLLGLAPAVLLFRRTFATHDAAARFLDWFVARSRHGALDTLACALAALLTLSLRPLVAERITTCHELEARRRSAVRAVRARIAESGSRVAESRQRLLQQASDEQRDLDAQRAAWRRARQDAEARTVRERDTWFDGALQSSRLRAAALLGPQSIPGWLAFREPSLPSHPMRAMPFYRRRSHISCQAITGTDDGVGRSRLMSLASACSVFVTPTPGEPCVSVSSPPTVERLQGRADRRATRVLGHRLHDIGPYPRPPAPVADHACDEFQAVFTAALTELTDAVDALIAEERGVARARQMDGRAGQLEFDLSASSNVLQNVCYDDADFLVLFAEHVWRNSQ